MKILTPTILKHKKFQAGITTALILLGTQLAPAMSEHSSFMLALGSISISEWWVIIAPVLTAIGFQGVADIGKEAAKINQSNSKDLLKKFDTESKGDATTV